MWYTVNRISNKLIYRKEQLGMYNYLSYNYGEAQRQYAERIREAQACHEQQRRMLQQLAQVTTWVGQRLIAWSERLQTRQALALPDSQRR